MQLWQYRIEKQRLDAVRDAFDAEDKRWSAARDFCICMRGVGISGPLLFIAALVGLFVWSATGLDPALLLSAPLLAAMAFNAVNEAVLVAAFYVLDSRRWRTERKQLFTERMRLYNRMSRSRA